MLGTTLRDLVTSPKLNEAALRVLQDYRDQLRLAELKRARRLLAGGASAEQVLEQLARRLTNKFLHAPTEALHHASSSQRCRLLLLLHHIYQLPDVH